MLVLERLQFHFLSAILVLFLNLKLGYDKDASTAIYHFYTFLASCFAVVGAIIADSCLGIYKTIVLTSMTFAAGAFTIAVGVVDSLFLPMQSV